MISKMIEERQYKESAEWCEIVMEAIFDFLENNDIADLSEVVINNMELPEDFDRDTVTRWWHFRKRMKGLPDV